MHRQRPTSSRGPSSTSTGWSSTTAPRRRSAAWPRSPSRPTTPGPATSTSPTTTAGTTCRWTSSAAAPTNPLVADPSSRRPVLTHPGADPGASRRPDRLRPGRLSLLGTGDGGPAGDPAENAQNLDLLLGKLLRIDPDAERRRALHDPSRQPVRRQARTGRDLGLRPARTRGASPSTARTKTIAIGDVGDDRYEEIDYLPIAKSRGANFGWPAFEGFAAVQGRPPAQRHDLPRAGLSRTSPAAPSSAATWSATHGSPGSAAARSSATTCSPTTARGSSTASARDSGAGRASSAASASTSATCPRSARTTRATSTCSPSRGSKQGSHLGSVYRLVPFREEI